MPQNKLQCCVVRSIVIFCVISSHDTKWYPLYCMYLYVLYDVNVLTRSSNCDHSMSSNLDAIVIPTHLGSWFFAEHILQSEILVLNHLVRELKGLADFCHWRGPQQGIIQSSPEFFTWSFLFMFNLWIYGHLWPLDSLDLFPWCLWHHTLKLVNSHCLHAAYWQPEVKTLLTLGLRSNAVGAGSRCATHAVPYNKIWKISL